MTIHCHSNPDPGLCSVKENPAVSAGQAIVVVVFIGPSLCNFRVGSIPRYCRSLLADVSRGKHASVSG